ncbi:hypothetical protein HU724_003490 [Pseudomonas iranensis]|uniref:hypothetical protein n=1 Tax=Pseudomonas iranensis TaxID=2745503 RepID=UPI0016467106|nr:hypothetical protein [Pseudomonas iranensis]QXI23354.1 hypothetical protein HU724_003490 [Pseudomonas iranensis]
MSNNPDVTHDQQATWPGLAGLASLKVKFDANDNTQSRAFFANGRMQIKVQVLVSGVDADGNATHLPANVMESIELVHYATSKTLRDGWVASAVQGRFTIEARPAPTAGEESDDDTDSVHPQVRTFWVSSSSAGTTQIGARLSLNGERILSNGTTLSSVHDSSVTIEAQPPKAYDVNLFRWYQTRRGNEEPGNRIWNYYLGLYPQGEQVKLVDWIVDGEDAGVDIVFARGNKLNENKTNYMLATLVRPERNKVDVSLPYRGDPIAFKFYADAITRDSKLYSVRVNDRDGELTVMQALSEYSEIAPMSRSGEIFHFRAVDQYGTEHKLAIRLNFHERNLYLERG